jgi:hypothetical protein
MDPGYKALRSAKAVGNLADCVLSETLVTCPESRICVASYYFVASQKRAAVTAVTEGFAGYRYVLTRKQRRSGEFGPPFHKDGPFFCAEHVRQLGGGSLPFTNREYFETPEPVWIQGNRRDQAGMNVHSCSLKERMGIRPRLERATAV